MDIYVGAGALASQRNLCVASAVQQFPTLLAVQDDLSGQVGAVSGTLVEAMSLIGLPPARLRLAIPRSLLGGSSKSITGRAALGAAACRKTAPQVATLAFHMYGQPRLGAQASFALAKRQEAALQSRTAAKDKLTRAVKRISALRALGAHLGASLRWPSGVVAAALNQVAPSGPLGEAPPPTLEERAAAQAAEAVQSATKDHQAGLEGEQTTDISPAGWSSPDVESAQSAASTPTLQEAPLTAGVINSPESGSAVVFGVPVDDLPAEKLAAPAPPTPVFGGNILTDGGIFHIPVQQRTSGRTLNEQLAAPEHAGSGPCSWRQQPTAVMGQKGSVSAEASLVFDSATGGTFLMGAQDPLERSGDGGGDDNRGGAGDGAAAKPTPHTSGSAVMPDAAHLNPFFATDGLEAEVTAQTPRRPSAAAALGGTVFNVHESILWDEEEQKSRLGSRESGFSMSGRSSFPDLPPLSPQLAGRLSSYDTLRAFQGAEAGAPGLSTAAPSGSQPSQLPADAPYLPGVSVGSLAAAVVASPGGSMLPPRPPLVRASSPVRPPSPARDALEAYRAAAASVARNASPEDWGRARRPPSPGAAQPAGGPPLPAGGARSPALLPRAAPPPLPPRQQRFSSPAAERPPPHLAQLAAQRPWTDRAGADRRHSPDVMTTLLHTELDRPRSGSPALGSGGSPRTVSGPRTLPGRAGPVAEGFRLGSRLRRRVAPDPSVEAALPALPGRVDDGGRASIYSRRSGWGEWVAAEGDDEEPSAEAGLQDAVLPAADLFTAMQPWGGAQQEHHTPGSALLPWERPGAEPAIWERPPPPSSGGAAATSQRRAAKRGGKADVAGKRFLLAKGVRTEAETFRGNVPGPQAPGPRLLRWAATQQAAQQAALAAARPGGSGPVSEALSSAEQAAGAHASVVAADGAEAARHQLAQSVGEPRPLGPAVGSCGAAASTQALIAHLVASGHASALQAVAQAAARTVDSGPAAQPVEVAGAAAEAAAQAAADRIHAMTGTALMFALASLRNFCAPEVLEQEVAKAARFFAGTTDEVGHSFRRLHFLFCGLLFPCNMPRDKRWLARCRLWRLILTQARALGPFGPHTGPHKAPETVVPHPSKGRVSPPNRPSPPLAHCGSLRRSTATGTGP